MKKSSMKKSLGTLVICGAMMMASGSLLAQSYDHDHDNHPHHEMYDRGHQEGWYRQGGRVPDDYRHGNYIVSDWHREHLRPPPRGYHYVRSDNGDFLLVAVTTGVIASIIASH
ncbi:RcnB family protein [Rhodanobacter sp. A1T4]|jgi:Ni/Co efflux regulator RcnB|uniref:RcnB family protein n=1 Tax=Rhodanobacter sp. A1T4 TaxID=2723087 RepID=UPI0018505EFC|nr:RcnB family protein [Rhodanobacter sp. A1T4]MBB6245817.1 Ni/Co efflux regulator RcnB [Rhodanobacter sp. A1T4]